jgi:hypothetical protein
MESAGDNSQASTVSTVPNSPTRTNGSSLEPTKGNLEFARLIPKNLAARIAFSEIVENAISPHVVKYMHVHPVKQLAEEMSASDGSEEESDLPPPLSISTGYYCFNMEVMPSSYGLGWVAGRGRPDLDHGGVDFQLTRNTNNHVAGRHVRFYHTSAGMFIVRSDARTVVVDGKENFRDAQRAITSSVTGLSFGDLTYTLEFTDLPTWRYREQLLRARRASGEEYDPPNYLDPTPSGTDYVVQMYLIKAVFAQGSTCTVSSGYHKLTGNPVAIKKIKRQGWNSASIDSEVRLVRALSPHVRSMQDNIPYSR